MILILMIAGFGTSCHSGDAAEGSKPEQKPQKSMETITPVKGGLDVPYELPAQLAAWQQVSLFPRMNGFVQKVYVDIGQPVRKGDLLMTIEAPEQGQAVLQAQERLAKSESDYQADKDRYDRLTEANRTPGAVSPLDLSNAHARMEAALSLRNAEKAASDAQQIMSGYLQLRAPFDGLITERNVSVGTLVSASDRTRPMLEIKQADLLRLQFDLPEAVAPLVHVGDSLDFSIASLPGRSFPATLSRLSGNVGAALRNMRAEADIHNVKGPFSPGMFARVHLTIRGDTMAWNIPSSALVTATSGKYILLSTGQHVRKIPVRTGQTNEGRVEVYGDIHVDDHLLLHADEEIAEH
jgi:RND family efflux transporter MFP subunit